MTKICLSLLLSLSFLSLMSCSSKSKEEMSMDPKVLAEAYHYGFPLVLMDITKQVSTNVATPDSEKIRAPINQFAHATKFPDANFKDVVRANVDTMYSTAWLDLSKEPMVVEIPDTAERYYLMPMLDGWSNVYSSPGKRTTGTDIKTFVIVGPNWKGDIPPKMPIIHSPTDITWIIGRIQTNSPQDATTTVAKIQNGMKLYPLSSMGQDYIPPVGTVNGILAMNAPVDQVFALSTREFFNRLNKLMVNNPPAEADKAFLAKFKRYNIGPGEKFKIFTEDEKEVEGIESLPHDVREIYEREKTALAKPVNGWMMPRNVGSYGTAYHKRAVVAYAGLGANLDTDALYPTAITDGHGEEFDGRKKYVIHFSKSDIPKVNAFWSMTVYGPDSFLVNNPINRYSLGDRNKLKYNRDGSLDIYLQNMSPGKNLESNWLPIPDSGKFDVTVRMYWPKPDVLNPSYTLPPIMPKISSDVTEL